jgi:hypothetical protein
MMVSTSSGVGTTISAVTIPNMPSRTLDVGEDVAVERPHARRSR